MKHYVTLTTCLLLLTIVATAQIPEVNSMGGWDWPTISKEYVQTLRLKKLYIYSSGNAPLRGGGEFTYHTAKFMEYDRNGNITTEGELVGADTTLMKDYYYSEKNLLSWEYIEDRVWNKKFKVGHRYNCDGTRFQTKTYEYLNENDLMLVDTRYYVWDKRKGTPELKEIKIVERSQVVEKQVFQKSKDGLTLLIEVQSPEEEILKTVQIDFQKDQQPSRILKEGENKEEFRYAYDINGNLLEINWYENQESKGFISYEYDGSGKIAYLKKFTSENTASSVEEFEFDYLIY